MITTIVVWPQSTSELHPTSLQRAELDEYVLSLCPGIVLWETRKSVLSDDGSELTVTRIWPTVELAQTWINHIMSTYDVTSAVVNNVPDWIDDTKHQLKICVELDGEVLVDQPVDTGTICVHHDFLDSEIQAGHVLKIEVQGFRPEFNQSYQDKDAYVMIRLNNIKPMVDNIKYVTQ